ncbi:MAG: DUF1697 domain-containing protein [Candidatus Shapirobacteria bacterium]|nr:DUF1697 domain-containing protein [Candidatus Shapirobacteria bacterium]
MKYVALLRGINVGGKRKIEMEKLREIFKGLGFINVSTYINSGNVIFGSKEKTKSIKQKIELELQKIFNDRYPVLIKKIDDLKKITQNIPNNWQNNDKQRTDVAFLFEEIDNEKILEELPIKKEFIDIRYVRGAIFWNVKRKNVYKSNLSKLISHKLYKYMTIRNVNTVRYLSNKL